MSENIKRYMKEDRKGIKKRKIIECECEKNEGKEKRVEYIEEK